MFELRAPIRLRLFSDCRKCRKSLNLGSFNLGRRGWAWFGFWGGGGGGGWHTWRKSLRDDVDLERRYLEGREKGEWRVKKEREKRDRVREVRRIRRETERERREKRREREREETKAYVY